MKLEKRNTTSCYVHIPFCFPICSYCDFCKLYYSPSLVMPYLSALEQEVKTYYQGEVLKTLYIGGGTPSLLSMDEMRRLFSILSLLKKEEGAEFTIEVNVKDITEEKLKFWKEHGVNRLSIGVETVQEKYFTLLKRTNDKEEVKKGITLARKYFSNINIDLMYAFPGETKKDLEKDLEFILSLHPEHISIYSLMIEEHTPLYLENIEPLDDEEEYAMYERICHVLKNFGYRHYEVSNYAKKGCESLHNLVYWNNESYYGFGLGASGFLDNIRYTNTKSLKHYLEGHYRYEEEKMTKEMNMENEMMLGLRKLDGVDKEKFQKKYQLEIKEAFDIIDLRKKDLLSENEKCYYIKEENMYISNSILVEFVGGSKNGEKRKNKKNGEGNQLCA